MERRPRAGGGGRAPSWLFCCVCTFCQTFMLVSLGEPAPVQAEQGAWLRDRDNSIETFNEACK